MTSVIFIALREQYVIRVCADWILHEQYVIWVCADWIINGNLEMRLFAPRRIAPLAVEEHMPLEQRVLMSDFIVAWRLSSWDRPAAADKEECTVENSSSSPSCMTLSGWKKPPDGSASGTEVVNADEGGVGGENPEQKILVCKLHKGWVKFLVWHVSWPHPPEVVSRSWVKRSVKIVRWRRAKGPPIWNRKSVTNAKNLPRSESAEIGGGSSVYEKSQLWNYSPHLRAPRLGEEVPSTKKSQCENTPPLWERRNRWRKSHLQTIPTMKILPPSESAEIGGGSSVYKKNQLWKKSHCENTPPIWERRNRWRKSRPQKILTMKTLLPSKRRSSVCEKSHLRKIVSHNQNMFCHGELCSREVQTAGVRQIVVGVVFGLKRPSRSAETSIVSLAPKKNMRSKARESSWMESFIFSGSLHNYENNLMNTVQ